MTGHTSTDLMYAITLHQPWASLIALGLKTVETRSWPAPARLVAQRIAIHAGKRVVRQPGDAIERDLRVRLGEDWRLTMPTGAVLATAVLAGMAQVADMDLRAGYAVHDLSTEVGCAVGTRRTPIDPWGDFSSGRWLWFLTDVDTLPEPAPAVGRQSFWLSRRVPPALRRTSHLPDRADQGPGPVHRGNVALVTGPQLKLRVTKLSRGRLTTEFR